MGSFRDLTGQRFGRLVAIRAERDVEGRRYNWICQCDCGNTIKASSISLTTRRRQSCGCIMHEILIKRNTTHGKSRERLYRVWKGMRSRCYNPNHTSYAKYGGRGIEVCESWRTSYEAFREWALATGYDPNAPYGECTLDRIDVNGGYSPDNCRWVNEFLQANNKRDNRYITFNGKTMSVSDWGKELGIDQSVLYARLNNLKWSEEKALTTPVRKCKKRTM